MVYHVGSPAIFDGNRFLPETGTPIWKIVRNSTVLADCEPEPFTVATCRLKSLISGFCPGRLAISCGPISVVAMSPLPSRLVPVCAEWKRGHPCEGPNDFGSPQYSKGRCLGFR